MYLDTILSAVSLDYERHVPVQRQFDPCFEIRYSSPSPFLHINVEFVNYVVNSAALRFPGCTSGIWVGITIDSDRSPSSKSLSGPFGGRDREDGN